MLEGMYSAAAGMTAQQHKLTALSNDIANVNTTGYKRVRVAFRDLLYTPQGLATVPNAQEGAGTAASVIGRGAAQGAITETGEPLDVALEGRGFLVVRQEDGTRVLTRDGHLRIDDRGRLGTSGGQLVDPPVRVPAGTTAKDVKISPDGRVAVGQRTIGRLQVVTVTAPDGLEPEGDNAFRATAASGAPTPAGAGTRVVQGALELSNVQLSDAMVDMIEAQRAFEMASRAIQAQDEMLGFANGVKR
jgi:flagellar basal-body rod protein FlgG